MGIKDAGKALAVLSEISDPFAGFDVPEPEDIRVKDVVPTGFYAFDHEILGIGGFPMQSMIELYGEEHGGKTLTALRVAAMIQRKYPDRPVVWIDTENSFDETWAARQGVDTSRQRLRVHYTTVAETAMEYMLKYLETGVPSLIVVDSIGNVNVRERLGSQVFEKDKKGELKNKERPGILAKTNQDFVKSVTEIMNRVDTMMILCNQVRTKIGVMFGNPETTPGGHALKHNCHIRARCRKVKQIPETGEPEGLQVGYKVIKNKYAIGRTTDETNHPTYYYDDGIVKAEAVSLFEEAIRGRILVKNGGWFTLTNKAGEKVGQWQGEAKVIDALVNDPEFLMDFREVVREFDGSRSDHSVPSEVAEE